jgi:hypothetical protein
MVGLPVEVDRVQQDGAAEPRGAGGRREHDRGQADQQEPVAARALPVERDARERRGDVGIREQPQVGEEHPREQGGHRRGGPAEQQREREHAGDEAEVERRAAEPPRGGLACGREGPEVAVRRRGHLRWAEAAGGEAASAAEASAAASVEPWTAVPSAASTGAPSEAAPAEAAAAAAPAASAAATGAPSWGPASPAPARSSPGRRAPRRRRRGPPPPPRPRRPTRLAPASPTRRDAHPPRALAPRHAVAVAADRSPARRACS